MDKKELYESACEIFSEIVEIRRDFHRHPEFGGSEYRTSKIIRDKLVEYGVDSVESPVPTAVVGLIHGLKDNGKCVALRADIDALPVKEQTGLPYASENEGFMHACGHDMHSSMLLGVAKILASRRDEFDGVVKLIFQHSEDTLPGGAKELVEKGVMENPKVDAVYGLHVYPSEEIGKINVLDGPATTSFDVYDFTVNGKGGHGSAPHTANDPIFAACQAVTLLQQIPSRRIDASETVIFPICTFNAGDAVNIIPATANFSGVARTYNNKVRPQIKDEIEKVIKGVESISGCHIDIKHIVGYPSCFNDKATTDIARKALIKNIGKENVIEAEGPYSFSEDFSYYSEMTGIPSSFMFLSAGHELELAPLHNPRCAVKEEAMKTGMTAMASVAIEFLNN